MPLGEQSDIQLLRAYLDNALSPNEIPLLEERICSEEDLAELLFELSCDEAIIREWSNSKHSETRTFLKIPSYSNHPFSFLNSKRGLYPSLFVLFLIAIGSIFFFLENESKFKKKNEQTLLAGSVNVSLPTGVKALITAPATFKVTGENEIYLSRGNLLAEVTTEKGKGFTVNTPSGSVVDLGTIFNVEVDRQGTSHVQVFRGRVIASRVNHQGVVQSSRQIEANQAMKIDVTNSEIIDAPYFSNTFITSLRKEYGITQLSTNVVFQEKVPTLLISEKPQPFEHDDQIFVFPERKKVLLTEDLQLEISEPGSYQTVKDISKEKGLVPAGKAVDCFRIYYDPANNTTETFLRIQGEVLFDRPILGVIFSATQLSKTNRWFQPLLQDQFERNQGAEFGVSRQEIQDEITISKDRKTLFFKLATKGPYPDQFRVIVQSQGDSPQLN